MKNIIGFLWVALLFVSCTQNNNTKAKLPEVKSTEKVATFAGGCFWSIQEGFLELKGVIKATSGYAGGKTENPTYEEVGTEQTGHAESVQVIYDPKVISFAQLVEAFLYMHDPTQLNRQGPDVGTSYRSVAFYRTADEKQQIEAAILKYDRSQLHTELVVTEVEPFKAFYPAENYHQNYYRTHPNDAYITNVCGPKVEKLRAALPHLLKDEFK
jgi:peptide-methionine (S)-S-oxide reductase